MTKLRASMGMIDLDLPGDGDLHQAAGRFALAHGQLELMLRMTIKTLSGLSVKEALNATDKTKNWELRAEALKLFKRKTSEPNLVLKLKALLGACEQLSEQRNRILHNAWAIAPDGSVVMKERCTLGVPRRRRQTSISLRRRSRRLCRLSTPPG